MKKYENFCKALANLEDIVMQTKEKYVPLFRELKTVIGERLK